MINLDTTTKSLEVKLAGAVTTNQLVYSANYVDTNLSGVPVSETNGLTNNGTAVTMVSAPASTKRRIVKSFSIYQKDTVDAVVTVQINDNGTLRPLVVITIPVGATLMYTESDQWKMMTAAGLIATSASGGSTGANTALSNLSGVAINAALLPDTAGIRSLGSGTLPWQYLWLSGDAGTPGTNNHKLTGVSTSGTRVVTFQDKTYTVGDKQFLAEISGTTTNASAENFTLYAFSAGDLTVKDRLLVVGTWEAVTQQTASLFLYNSTDSKNLAEVDGTAAITAGLVCSSFTYLMAAQSSSTLISAIGSASRVSADNTNTNPLGNTFRNTVTTAWTGTWTLVLRQGGVTAGGTGRYEFTVFRLVGQ